jgi:hypothetical protein
MITPMTQKPSVFEKPSQEGDEWFICFDTSGEPYAYITLNCSYPPWAIIHLEVTGMTPKHMREAVNVDWVGVVEVCKQNDCNAILAETTGNLEDTKLFQRFVKYFGFTNFIERVTSVQFI